MRDLGPWVVVALVGLQGLLALREWLRASRERIKRLDYRPPEDTR